MTITIRLEQAEDDETTREWMDEMEKSRKSKGPDKEKSTPIPPSDQPERNQDLHQI